MQGPYRPPPNPPDPALAALAAQGDQLRRAAEVERAIDLDRDATTNMRTAIGAFRGSILRRVFIVLCAVCTATFITGVVAVNTGYEDAENIIPAFFPAIVFLMLAVFVPPLASAGAVAAEERWASSLPFRLDGYFQVLGSRPDVYKTIRWVLTWQGGRPPEQALLSSVVAAVDPGARVERVDGHGAIFLSGKIDGSTGISVNRSPVYRNHRLPKAVHDTIDRVLVTLHHTYPIASVTISAK